VKFKVGEHRPALVIRVRVGVQTLNELSRYDEWLRCIKKLRYY
jgi:hypothetical protein